MIEMMLMGGSLQDHIEEIRRGLHTPGEMRMTALRDAKQLRQDELQGLLPDLLFLASWGHGTTHIARELIRSLPRDWVLQNIEQQAEPLLASGNDEDYLRLIEVYRELDPNLARRLAMRASAHTNPEIALVGREFLEEFPDRS